MLEMLQVTSVMAQQRLVFRCDAFSDDQCDAGVVRADDKHGRWDQKMMHHIPNWPWEWKRKTHTLAPKNYSTPKDGLDMEDPPPVRMMP